MPILRVRRPGTPIGVVSVLLLTLLTGCSLFNRGPQAETDPTPMTPAAAGAPVDSTRTDEPPAIRVRISEEERTKLVAQVQKDLEVASATLTRIPDVNSLSREERERWETLRRYVELAGASLEAKDLRAASELALKARLLAEEIQPG